jgi:hypothetical protein
MHTFASFCIERCGCGKIELFRVRFSVLELDKMDLSARGKEMRGLWSPVGSVQAPQYSVLQLHGTQGG